MAQRITNVCDECLLAAGEDAPAQTWAVTITPPGEKATPYEIDVCEKHGKPLVDLAAALAEFARRTDRRRALPASGAVDAPVSAAFPCPVCEHVAKTRKGLESHIRAKHGKTVAEAAGAASLACPVKGCGRAFAKPQGLARHLTAPVHGWESGQARAAVASLKSGK